MQGRQTARQAREAAITGAAGGLIGDAMRRAGVPGFATSLLGDVATAAAGAALQEAPREVRQVMGAVGSALISPEPNQAPPARQSPTVLEQLGIDREQLEALQHISAEHSAAMAQASSIAVQLQAALDEARDLVNELRAATPPKKAPAKKKA